MSIYMSHPPIFGSPWQHTSLQAREVASTCEPDTADWCLEMADDYPIIPRETIVFPHSADIFTIFTNQTALGTWEILGIWLKTNQKLPPPIPPLRKLKMATHGVGIQGSPPVQTSHCPASHRSRKPRRSWPQMDFGPKVDETSHMLHGAAIYGNIKGVNIDGIHGTPYIAAPWILWVTALARNMLHSSILFTWETKSHFFCSIVVDTCFRPVLLVWKAWSDEPKYSLLTHVKSKKNDSIGILFGIFLANCRAECVVGPTLAQSRSNWHVLSIKCYLFSIKMKQAHTNCWWFCSAIEGKTMKLKIPLYSNHAIP